MPQFLAEPKAPSGQALLNYRGLWASTNAYRPGDAVSHFGQIWLNTVAQAAGTSFTPGNWNLIGDMGAVDTRTASVTLDHSSGQYQFVSASSAAVTLTLPTPPYAGITFCVKKTDAAAHNVTVAGNIDGVTNFVLTDKNQYVEIVSDASGHWLIVGQTPTAGSSTLSCLGTMSNYLTFGTAATDCGSVTFTVPASGSVLAEVFVYSTSGSQVTVNMYLGSSAAGTDLGGLGEYISSGSTTPSSGSIYFAKVISGLTPGSSYTIHLTGASAQVFSHSQTVSMKVTAN